MFERFTDRARRVVVLAQEEARMLNHNYIGTEHILLGLIHEGEGVAAKALESLGIALEGVRQQVEEIIGQGQQAPSGHIPFTPRAKKVLELSLREALQLGHNYIGTEHILLGLIREGEGVAAQVLVKLGAELNRVRQQVLQLLSGYQGKEPAEGSSGGRGEGTPSSSLVLDQFGRNLTQPAREGKLDPVIGREKEIEPIMQVLPRRTKNNPALIGEPGVGKTAVVEGLRSVAPSKRWGTTAERPGVRSRQGQREMAHRPLPSPALGLSGGLSRSTATRVRTSAHSSNQRFRSSGKSLSSASGWRKSAKSPSVCHCRSRCKTWARVLSLGCRRASCCTKPVPAEANRPRARATWTAQPPRVQQHPSRAARTGTGSCSGRGIAMAA